MGSESPVVRSCLCAVYSSMLSSHPVWDAVWPQLSRLLEVFGVSVLKGSASDLSSSRHSLCSRAYLCPFFSNSLWLLYASPLQSLRKIHNLSSLQPFSVGHLFADHVETGTCWYFLPSDISFQVKVIHLFFYAFIQQIFGTFLVVEWLRLHSPSARGLGLIPDQETRSCLPQLKIPPWN